MKKSTMSKSPKTRPETSPALTNMQRAIERQLGPLVYRKPESPRPYRRNPRRYPELQIVKLMASIGQFGFALPVLVSEDNEIIAGEARVKVAQRLGMSEVPALVTSDWSAPSQFCAPSLPRPLFLRISEERPSLI
jgi:hypothetical protein